jgi:hypothetical protein
MNKLGNRFAADATNRLIYNPQAGEYGLSFRKRLPAVETWSALPHC